MVHVCQQIGPWPWAICRFGSGHVQLASWHVLMQRHNVPLDRQQGG